MAETYPYLVANLIALPLLIAQFVVAGPQRAAMFASGALFTPWGALAPLLSDYWSPARVGGLPMGIEDFVISFQTGAAIWFWASLPVRQTIVVDLRLLPMVAKSACFAVGFLAAAAVLAAIGVSAITQVIVLPAILATILLQSRPTACCCLCCTVSYLIWQPSGAPVSFGQSAYLDCPLAKSCGRSSVRPPMHSCLRISPELDLENRSSPDSVGCRRLSQPKQLERPQGVPQARGFRFAEIMFCQPAGRTVRAPMQTP